MNIKELSIGDFLFFIDGNCSVRVQEIYNDAQLLISDGDSISEPVHITHLHPIPLTPKILEMSGFTQLEPSINYDWWCLDDKDKFLVGFGFGKEEGRTATGWDFDTTGSCDYKRQIGVHELQNLLRLAGIDLELKVC